MTEADIGMTEHRSKNTLGRSVPIKNKTDVEEDGTSEDGSPGPVCICLVQSRTCAHKLFSKGFENIPRHFQGGH